MTVYGPPTARFVKTKTPASLLEVLLDLFVELLTIVISASSKALPERSVTTPLKFDVVSTAKENCLKKQSEII